MNMEPQLIAAVKVDDAREATCQDFTFSLRHKSGREGERGKKGGGGGVHKGRAGGRVEGRNAFRLAEALPRLKFLCPREKRDKNDAEGREEGWKEGRKEG